MDQHSVRRESRFLAERTGLRLHYVDYRPASDSVAIPVVCLAGLTRTALDFEALALALARRGRRVLALGLSRPRPLGLGRRLETLQPGRRGGRYSGDAGGGRRSASAVFVGTSRGGIHLMRLAARQPEILRAAVLNDIGPVIDVGGLRRIKGYVGRQPGSASMAIALAAAEARRRSAIRQPHPAGMGGMGAEHLRRDRWSAPAAAWIRRSPTRWTGRPDSGPKSCSTKRNQRPWPPFRRSSSARAAIRTCSPSRL